MSRCVAEDNVYSCCPNSRISFKPCVTFGATVVDFLVLLVRIAELSHDSLQQPVNLGAVLVRFVDECTS